MRICRQFRCWEYAKANGDGYCEHHAAQRAQTAEKIRLAGRSQRR